MNQFVEKLKKYISLFIIYIFNCFPIKKNKIFLFSYYGSQYGCNPKYITEYILENYPKGKFDIVWAFDNVNPRKNLSGFRKVKIMTLQYFYELCTSKVIITNFRTTDLFVKRKSQYYIQTWHSSLRLKQIEKDAEAALPPTYVEMAKRDSKKCDLLLSGCKYSSDIFRRSFWYDGEIFEHGTPRNDFLLRSNPKIKGKIIKKLNISSDYKVILYAPTFRKNNDLTVYNLDYSKVVTTLEKKYGGKWVFLIKLHPHLISRSEELVYGNDVINVTSYNDIQELLNISDALITDYSSLMFDYSITKKPCFLYAPDFKDYTSQDRNLYFNLLELPFKTAMNNDELINEIRFFDPGKYAEDIVHFFKKVGSFEDGTASEMLVERINEVCFNPSRRNINEAL
ncbi:CDP-glycerol glycerophosphotransferase family protein [Bacillus sp. FJAT-50079]|uniref:CDP-glycerol glycerophosphotransferase family protein n=1 Tax=Bacillus sp. FJAT-50079 TaxID=2833577 RepID=UPI001BC9F8A0|nr:CDP-glycerol glycerophosphotransferase family protein [Bacillus sp. FJAT-50079]MBS4209152.1 CDP-glycerol glycerophosphotransferase family protein [Bacillus sp. FJAT-50079]